MPFRPATLHRPPQTLPDPGLCQDAHEQCRKWADAGECKRNPGFMTAGCGAACGLCEPCAGPSQPCYARNRDRNGYLVYTPEDGLD